MGPDVHQNKKPCFFCRTFSFKQNLSETFGGIVLTENAVWKSSYLAKTIPGSTFLSGFNPSWLTTQKHNLLGEEKKTPKWEQQQRRVICVINSVMTERCAESTPTNWHHAFNTSQSSTALKISSTHVRARQSGCRSSLKALFPHFCLPTPPLTAEELKAFIMEIIFRWPWSTVDNVFSAQSLISSP